MKFRKHDWLDTKTRKVKYGIQCKASPDAPWMHLVSGLKACIYATEEARDKKLAALRKEHR